ncbi:FAD-dependent monooxygenase [Dactylosporangium sp. NBC_01737]|uniref:FAD-dependent oxidoreductase n=1 Tax=Dactylosporangium sp. NBC_01737 TaxID=2975959 RepID=UPI002E11F19B|nr:FAD-dependent monooxygenase [Dactylosporangium sp. NBC_01737]
MSVIVAGAGPVGLTAALTLHRLGVDVTVLEAGDALATESRASTFHPPSLEMLAELGVLPALLAQGLVSPRFQYRERGGGVIAELDMALLAGDTPYPFRLQCEQSKLTRLLLPLLPPGTVHFGQRVEGLAQDGAGVTVHAGDTFRGDWLIGADGANSAVRRSLFGDAFEGITYPDRFLVGSTDEDLTALLPGIAEVNYLFDPVEWLVVLRTPDHWRVLLPTPPDTPDDVEKARLADRLLGVADPGHPWRVAHTTLYRVHQRVAASFRTGRVLLAGDAAHINNPLGGMGMNSGIHDAVLLARAVAAGDDDAVTATAAARRDVARNYVQKTTHSNWEKLRSGGASAYADELRALAADPVAARAHLLRSSMIASLREGAA